MTRIMVIDDNRATRLALEVLLKLTGYDVVGFDGGEEALRSLRDGGLVDLVILDVAMPGMDGNMFLRELRRDASLAAIPVVAYTSADARLPGVETVRKGDDPDVLLACVERYCPPDRPLPTRPRRGPGAFIAAERPKRASTGR